MKNLEAENPCSTGILLRGGGQTLVANLGVEDVSPQCHPELADLRTAEQSESRIASRLSRLEQSSLGKILRAWSKSKTDSGSIQHGVLSVSLDRFRNKFGMTPPEAASCLGWALKSHVQPLWMALSAFTMAEILLSLTLYNGRNITLPHDNRRGCGDYITKFDG